MEVSLIAIQLVLAVLALESLIAVPLGWLRMQERVQIFFFLTTGRAALQAILSVGFLLMGWAVEGLLLAGFIAALLQAIALFFVTVAINRACY